VIEVVGVMLNDKGRQYYFSPNGYLELAKGTNVVVETEKGLQFGQVLTPAFKIAKEEIRKELKKIIRIADQEDVIRHEKNILDAKNAIKKSKKLIEELALNMLVVDAYYTFDREQLVFKFLSDSRVDFRELVKKLALIYKTRIELRQIGVRDKAKEIGGIALCGKEFCCKSMDADFDSISINMAKNQNISLNPNKINGACGRLLCCLRYEDDLYKENRQKMPKLGDRVETPKGIGKVVSLDILNLTYKVEIPEYGVLEIKSES
jgi:cell fate regulator YaaT (PSP1 superfamily)